MLVNPDPFPESDAEGPKIPIPATRCAAQDAPSTTRPTKYPLAACALGRDFVPLASPPPLSMIPPPLFPHSSFSSVSRSAQVGRSSATVGRSGGKPTKKKARPRSALASSKAADLNNTITIVPHKGAFTTKKMGLLCKCCGHMLSTHFTDLDVIIQPITCSETCRAALTQEPSPTIEPSFEHAGKDSVSLTRLYSRIIPPPVTDACSLLYETHLFRSTCVYVPSLIDIRCPPQVSGASTILATSPGVMAKRKKVTSAPRQHRPVRRHFGGEESMAGIKSGLDASGHHHHASDFGCGFPLNLLGSDLTLTN